MRDIQTVLEQWGAWAADENSGVDYSHIAAGFKGLIPSSKRSKEQCSDSDGLKIDMAITQMKDTNSYYFQLIIMYYLKGYTLRAMGGKMGISHNEVAKRLQAAEGYIDGWLASSGVRLESDVNYTKNYMYVLA
ncbi:TPA: antiterminator Q family protein [Morganella morganii]